MNDWDRKIPNLDVVDDYRNEKKEIQACQGKNFPFSFGDVSQSSLKKKKYDSFCIIEYFFSFVKYVVKILMGGVDSWFDDLDEKKVSSDLYGRPNMNALYKHKQMCCTIL